MPRRAPPPSSSSALPYQWSQDLNTVTVTVPLPAGTRGKDCNVVIERKRLQVQVKGSDPVLEGELFEEIAKDDSSWTIGGHSSRGLALTTDSGVMSIELEKFS